MDPTHALDFDCTTWRAFGPKIRRLPRLANALARLEPSPRNDRRSSANEMMWVKTSVEALGYQQHPFRDVAERFGNPTQSDRSEDVRAILRLHDSNSLTT